jgi:hypothetical protein
MVSLAHSLAFVGLRKLRELLVFLQFPVHDGLDSLHVLGRFWTLELLVTKQSKLMKDLAWAGAVPLTFELANSWFQVLFHDCVRLRKASFSKMVTLSSLAAI